MPCTLFSLLMLILFASISYYARSCGFEAKEIAEREVKYMDIIRPGKDLTDCTAEAHPLDNISFTKTGNFNGVRYYDIESGTLSASSHYTPLAEGVEFYEKKVKGKRYTVKDKPLNLGYYGILDNLDNCIIECYPTKEEAEKEAKILNGFVDGNGRLKSVI